MSYMTKSELDEIEKSLSPNGVKIILMIIGGIIILYYLLL